MCVPLDELRRRCATYREAVCLARSGRTAEGFEVLDLGLAWAEAIPFDPLTGDVGAPEPWRDELVELYQRAMVRYVDAYRPQMRFPTDLVDSLEGLVERRSRP